MHAASSTRILPQEQRSANFSTSRATVPMQHSRLKKYKHYKKMSLSASCSLPLSACVHLSACLHPSVSVKTSTKPLLPPCSSLTLHCITSIQTVRLHPFCLINASFTFEVQLFLIPASICDMSIENLHTPSILPGHIIPIRFGFITA